MGSLSVRRVEEGKAEPCEALLRSLPAWFGIESSLSAYVEDVRRLPTWIAFVDDEAVGFVSVAQHNEATAEVQVMAVRERFHRHGIGRALVGAAEDFARAQGCRLLEVKTLGPSRESAEYARTRAFYRAMGFLPLEELAELWGPRNPCLVLVKWLG